MKSETRTEMKTRSETEINEECDWEWTAEPMQGPPTSNDNAQPAKLKMGHAQKLTEIHSDPCTNGHTRMTMNLGDPREQP